MEQRRKIIIPTGPEGEETLSTPHFDTEATLAARPVVPLNEPVKPTPEMAYAAKPGGGAYATRATVSSSPWKRSTLVLIILAAVSVGVASGLAIGFYQTGRKASASAVIAQPTASEPQQATVQPEPSQSERVPQPEQTVAPEAEAQIPDAPAGKETKESATAKNNSDDDERSDDKPSARDNRKRDEEKASPPTVLRDKPPVAVPVREERDERDERDEDEDARRAERRERRREERREGRRHGREDNDDEPLEVPRRVERARQDINRIRDIFEGRQP